MLGFSVRSMMLSLAALAYCGVSYAQDGSGTEKLLKDAKLDYRKVKDGVFRVVVEGKAGTSVIVVEEKKMPWKDSKDKDILYAYVWCEIATAPADFKPSTAMLTRIAEVNDRIRFGSVGMSKEKDGSTAFYRNGTLFLRGADGEQLSDLVYLSYNEKFALQKELKAFIEEGK